MNRSILRRLGIALAMAVVASACDDGPAGPGPASLTVAVSGLPSGAAAAVVVAGPGDFLRTLSETETLSELAPGTYTITASAVPVGDASYAPLEASQAVTVSRGDQASADVEYANVAGSITINITGLPGGVQGTVVVTGPDGFQATVNSSRMLAGLSPGTYTVAATGVVAGDSTYQSRPSFQEVVVTGESAVGLDVVYGSAGSNTLNLKVDGLYLTQSVQTYDRSVPLVAGRDAFVRVFAVADQENTAVPPVRVRLYDSTRLLGSWTIAASSGAVAQSVQQGSLAVSWNVLIPGALIRPGVMITADVDPTNGVAEANEADNAYPLNGSLLPLTVSEVPPLRIDFLPVLQSVNGLVGRVTSANVNAFMEVTRRLHPLGAVDVAVRPTYTTGAPELDPENSTGAWPALLNELDALRVAEGTGRNLYGVVRTNYRSGFAGLAFVGGEEQGRQATAIGWDFLPDASEVVAHELGHNWSRRHAPCGNPGNPDREYPYPGGAIGVHGYDVRGGRLYAPTTFDIMGYCDNAWISDYTYLGVLRHRERFEATSSSARAQPSLLIWGRVSDRELVLEPSFHLHTKPVVPVAGGDLRIEGSDANGARLFSYRFDAAEIADSPGSERQFAFAVPLSSQLTERLVTVRLTDGVREVVRRRRTGLTEAAVTRAPASRGGVRIRWDPVLYPMAMIRDAASGRILSFARGGDVVLPDSGVELEAVVSDGVRSTRQRIENPGFREVPG